MQLGKDHEIGHDDGLELFRQMIDLRIGQRHEAPVSFPGRVVQRFDELDFGVEVLHVERTQHDTGTFSGAAGELKESLRR